MYFVLSFGRFFFLALDKPSFNQDNTPGHRHVVHATMLHFYSGEKKNTNNFGSRFAVVKCQL